MSNNEQFLIIYVISAMFIDDKSSAVSFVRSRQTLYSVSVLSAKSRNSYVRLCDAEKSGVE
jgi:hypothetical protein